MFNLVDEMCFKSKNLYNYANYILRQQFINEGKYTNYYEMKRILKTHAPYKEFGSQAAQQTLLVLDQNWRSFFAAIKDWKKNPNKYLGRPKLPKYKDKNGRNIVILSNIQCRIENDCLMFSWMPFRQYKVFTKVSGKLMQVRIIPKGSHYTLEIVYEIEVPEIKTETNRIIGIDLGISNLATVSNNVGKKPFIINGKVIKSINQYYSKKKAMVETELVKKNKKHWSKKLQRLSNRRKSKTQHILHKSSKYVVEWCISNNIDTVVIGQNEGWKQQVKLGKRNNQNFYYFPFLSLIQMIRYKCENVGIKVICVEESYTSGTSFLDNESPIKEKYNKSRRIKRGLFKSNGGNLINADLNGSYQIIKKVFPNAFINGIEGAHSHPVRLNIV